MSEPRTFTSYEAWQTACQVDGLEGPYQISGQPHMWQYIAKGRGTAAMWNYESRKGFVFQNSQASEKLAGVK